ncbi:MAG: PocR ligand-binding domain-containing protein [Desulfomonile tiedjei]|nr:PocR ligand-binding domain-containing protein [Desulfomonile tiedjei]
MTPRDLKTKEEWQEILNRFATETKMTATLTDSTGKQLIGTNSRGPLCAAVRENEKALTFICSQTNTAMLAVIRKILRPELDLCEAGLIRVVVPIVKDGSLIGQVTACGLASDEEEPNSFLVSKELGISEEKAIELSQSIPLGSEEELREICSRLFNELNTK